MWLQKKVTLAPKNPKELELILSFGSPIQLSQQNSQFASGSYTTPTWEAEDCFFLAFRKKQRILTYKAIIICSELVDEQLLFRLIKSLFDCQLSKVWFHYGSWHLDFGRKYLVSVSSTPCGSSCRCLISLTWTRLSYDAGIKAYVPCSLF